MVLGLLVHVTPSVCFRRILRSEALVYKSYFFRQPFYGNYSTLDSHTITVISHAFSYSSRKMASKTVTRSIKQLQVAITLVPYNLYPTLNSLTTKKCESRLPLMLGGHAHRHCSLFSPQTRRLTSQAQLAAL